VSTPPPRRAVVFSVEIGADSDDELARALHQLADQASRECFGDGNGASGGPASGWSWECSRIKKSNEEFHKEVQAWLEARAAEREQAAEEGGHASV
jgi:hypothetical protein